MLLHQNNQNNYTNYPPRTFKPSFSPSLFLSARTSDELINAHLRCCPFPTALRLVHDACITSTTSSSSTLSTSSHPFTTPSSTSSSSSSSSSTPSHVASTSQPQPQMATTTTTTTSTTTTTTTTTTCMPTSMPLTITTNAITSLLIHFDRHWRDYDSYDNSSPSSLTGAYVSSSSGIDADTTPSPSSSSSGVEETSARTRPSSVDTRARAHPTSSSSSGVVETRARMYECMSSARSRRDSNSNKNREEGDDVHSSRSLMTEAVMISEILATHCHSSSSSSGGGSSDSGE